MKMEYEAELLVIGGGTAGVICAIEAAAMGIRTILAERTGHIGGVGVQTLMGSFANLMVNTDGKPLLGGRLLELLDRMSKTEGMPYKSLEEAVCGRIGSPFTIPYQPVYYEKVLFDMVKAYGVTLFLNSSFYRAEEAGSRKKMYFTAAGRTFLVNADVVVDATGSAEVAAACGAPVVDQASSHGCLMRVGQVRMEETLCYIWKEQPWKPDPSYEPWLRMALGISKSERITKGRILLDPVCYDHAPKKAADDWTLTEERIQYIRERWEKEGILYTLELSLLRPLIRRAVDEGALCLNRVTGEGKGITFNGDGIAYGAWGTGVALCNVAKPYGFHSSDVEEETEAAVLAYDYNLAFYKFLKNYVPGFQKSELLDVGSQTISRSDQMISGCDELDGSEDRPLYHQTIYLFGGIYEHQSGVPVPYGKILPQKCENLLVIGKGSSHGNRYRSQLSCMAMGIAAAAASRVILDTGKTSHTIDREELKDQLIRMGVLLNA